jgi:3-oxoacid CoA-transferase subunit A
MAAASRVTIVESDEIVPPYELESELITTPGIYVDKLIHRK